MAPPSEELRARVDNLEVSLDNIDRAVFGDRENPKGQPGIISELSHMNSILLELRDSMRRINWILISAFITALCALVFNGVVR